MRPETETLLETAWSRFSLAQHREEIGAFVEWLQARGLGAVLEIGTMKGGTAWLWGQINGGQRVVSIDLPDGPFGGKDHGMSRQACLRRNEQLRVDNPHFTGYLGSSHDGAIARIVQQLGPFDMVFIDGDHRFAAVLADLHLYAPMVRPGGLVVFHDIEDTVFHRNAGVDVADVWRDQTGVKHEFTIHADWGGIGVLEVPA